MTEEMLHAFETDNGPGGISWEVTVGGRHLSLASLDQVREAALVGLARPDGSLYGMRRLAIAVYTLADWYAALERGDEETLQRPTYVIDGDPPARKAGAR
jgi:hypothetical protein